MENKNNDWLSSLEKDVHSRIGKDGILIAKGGILEKIFEIIKSENKQCVEFGAWDGKFLSNVYDLIKNKGWGGVLIEPDAEKYKDLLKTHPDSNKVICLDTFVDFEGVNTLDNILEKTPIDKSFDLLSIDIDGNDYHIWDSLKIYSPKVVIIEINPSIPSDISFIQKKDMKVNQGSSLLALHNLAKEKGYELVAATITNAFFVKREFFNLFEIKDNSPGEISKSTKYQTRIFQLFDGTIMVDGFDRLMFHDVKMNFKKLNPVPRFFRIFPPTMTPLRRLLFKMWRKGYKFFKGK